MESIENMENTANEENVYGSKYCSLRVKTVKILKTGNIYLSFIALGWCTAIAGPTLLDLATNVGKGVQEIASIYAFRSCGYVTGALIGGILFDKFHRVRTYITIMFLAAVMTFAIPWCSHLASLAFCLLVSGLALGSLDTGGNVWCLNIWTKQSGPYMQALHFLFGLGALVSPLFAEPFLRPLKRDVPQLNISEQLNNSEILSNISLLNDSLTLESEPIEEGYYIINAYAIAAGFMLLVTVSVVTLFIIAPADDEHAVSKAMAVSANKNSVLNVAFLVCCCFFYQCYGGMEVAYGQLIATYCVKSKLQLSKSVGSFVTSVFWGCFTVGRGLSIFWATKFSPLSMLICDFVIILISSMLLAIFGDTSEMVLWVCTGLNGLGMASVYASAMAWVEESYVITNKVASIFVVTCSSGEVIYPLVIGLFIEKIPMIIMYMTLACICFCTVMFAVMYKLANELHKNAPKTRVEEKDIQLANNVESANLQVQDASKTEVIS